MGTFSLSAKAFGPQIARFRWSFAFRNKHELSLICSGSSGLIDGDCSLVEIGMSSLFGLLRLSVKFGNLVGDDRLGFRHKHGLPLFFSPVLEFSVISSKFVVR